VEITYLLIGFRDASRLGFLQVSRSVPPKVRDQAPDLLPPSTVPGPLLVSHRHADACRITELHGGLTRPPGKGSTNGSPPVMMRLKLLFFG
jgi:hypothetical protein